MVGYAECSFVACGGTVLTISGCDQCTGDQYLKLYGESTFLKYDDDSCGTDYGCSTISYTVAGLDTVCSTLTVREGCYNSDTCGGSVTVFGVSALVPTIAPSSFPTRNPTLSPSVVPTLSLQPSQTPTTIPSRTPSAPTVTPSHVPSLSLQPSVTPSVIPSAMPSVSFAPTTAGVVYNKPVVDLM
eukprot:gene16497-21072_t